jgi:hypothetical protein
VMKAIAERTRTLKPDAAQGMRGLHLVPILGPSHDTPVYRLLDADTLASVKVTEISESGSVPELLVENLLESRVFLMDGQELVGAKQNRILNTDVLVPAGARLKIPVSCVEAGRWNYKSETFSPGKTASFTIRSGKQTRVHESLRRTGQHDADQGAVWQEVSQSLKHASCSSPTSSLHDAYAKREKDLVEFRKSFQLPEKAVGVAVFDGTDFRGMDIFDRHSTLQYFWDSLVDSYAIEWLGRTDDRPDIHSAAAEAITAILTQAAEATWETFGSPGEGEEARFAAETLAGSALVWEKQTVIHIQIFPSRSSGQSAPRHYKPRIHRPYRPEEELPPVY